MEAGFTDLRIMLIDDDPFQLKMLSHMLAALGVPRENVRTCLSGAEAMEALDGPEAGGRLIMLDLNMPQMDGVEVVRRLADCGHPGRLILVSGEDRRVLETAEKLARAHHLNVLGHLDKPVQRAALKDLLEACSAPPAVSRERASKAYPADEVRTALADRQFFNVYQPKVDVASGDLVGVEALVRWRHPEDGTVFPDQFIGVAEENALIDELTRMVLTEALRQARQWHEGGLPLRVAVNVSMKNLTRVEFADHVLREIALFGVPPKDLVLEVTESILATDMLVPLDILTRLRIKHVSLSIDDFGTGHSSLAQLRDMPFNELKIDRGFVHGAARNPVVRGIFEGSMTIAEQLGMTVVAEGVEDLEDWEFLREYGCHQAQGYFIAKPMPALALPAWLSEWRGRQRSIIGR